MAKISFELSPDEAKAFLTNLTTTAKELAGTSGKPVKPDKSAKVKTEDDDFEDVDDGIADDGTDAADDTEDEVTDDTDGDIGDDATGPTQSDVQIALRAYASASSKAAAVKLMKEKGGTDALSKLKESKYQTVIDAAKAATKKAKK